MPGIKSVYFLPESTGRYWCVVSVEQKYQGHSNHAGNAVIASTTGHYGVKGVIVVDHDIPTMIGTGLCGLWEGSIPSVMPKL